MRFGLKDVAELPSMDEFEKMASELEEIEPATVDEGDAATAAYEAEGSGGPELDENAPEEPDNDSPSPAENDPPIPAATSETNEKTEPAE
jgi:segregation and condensation protein B